VKRGIKGQSQSFIREWGLGPSLRHGEGDDSLTKADPVPKITRDRGDDMRNRKRAHAAVAKEETPTSVKKGSLLGAGLEEKAERVGIRLRKGALKATEGRTFFKLTDPKRQKINSPERDGSWPNLR